ncbi:hypothetical protein DSL72_006986 [Monilinia vaccinii-corymbosi]|uniref:2EXR domain-containing protein n=1 Tax=Monilinia vaccinii-corymbosi TaxID=61207 RepID=A0A8A3PLN7_9HELO|nr:hypothetical protein DSL72_006986 [Monilinia vaccinii-corymbosi]
MTPIHFNIRLFARTPPATAAEFARSRWLDLALRHKVGDPRLDRLGWLDLEKNSRVCTPVGSGIPVAQVDARPAVTSFPLFGKLAVEIQNQIWTIVSLNYPRVITMIEEDVDVVLYPNDDEYTVLGAKRPRFLNSCKGALSAMVSIYQPMFQLNPSHYHGNKKGVLVNPDIDLINFISLRFLHGQAPPLNYIGGIKHRGEFGMLRHVCLPIQEFHDNLQKVAKVIQQLPLLESVIVVAHLVDLTIPDALRMEFWIQDINFTRPDRKPRSDMQIKVKNRKGPPLVGAAAISLLFSRIASLTHRAGILESLGRVETMMRQEPNFPNRVLAQFFYRNHY